MGKVQFATAALEAAAMATFADAGRIHGAEPLDGPGFRGVGRRGRSLALPHHSSGHLRNGLSSAVAFSWSS